MEVILLIVVGAVFLAFRYARSGSGNGASQPPPQQHSESKLSASNTLEQPPVFDAEKATHLNDVRVLSGAAYITDGDTLRIDNTQIRLFGIDAPEINHPYGKKAKWALHKLCKGQIIRAEIIDEDDHGRTVARCYLQDGTDLSAEMVKQGLAIDWPKFSGGIYRSMETSDARKKLFLADARQKGQVHVWAKFEAKQGTR